MSLIVTQAHRGHEEARIGAIEKLDEAIQTFMIVEEKGDDCVEALNGEI